MERISERMVAVETHAGRVHLSQPRGGLVTVALTLARLCLEAMGWLPSKWKDLSLGRKTTWKNTADGEIRW